MAMWLKGCCMNCIAKGLKLFMCWAAHRPLMIALNFGCMGWPMIGMMRETAIRYSGQIIDVLIGHEKLIDGLHILKLGVKRALISGPFHQ
jgi:hypothetical protein